MAKKILVDTDILIEMLEKGKEELLRKLVNYELYTSYVSFYEYLWGYCYLGRDISKEKEIVEKIIDVIYPSQEILLKAMEIDVNLARKGEKISQADIIIAATALVTDMPLFTRNIKHFKRLEEYGLKLTIL
ncbi:MAG: VapC toxin family PIN domain ribonuclease [Thermofilum sp. ex4484_82]|nr:MAG: VapC toxin family PIN domain ribonuclease [Thermofilum sp. ex4484_82]OYT38888.1 MAG: VapC toxin family PIN domain ribonuclease [Archaeoglobales archaeon ex4484_92]